MDNSEEQDIRRKSGKMIMEALSNLPSPASLTDVVKYVADTQQVSQKSLKDLVKQVLEEGVQQGFIQKAGTKYTADVEASDKDDDDELEEKSRRRRGRKGRSRSRKRGRSRSRSRRRRR